MEEEILPNATSKTRQMYHQIKSKWRLCITNNVNKYAETIFFIMFPLFYAQKSGILTNEYAWRCLPDEKENRRGVQIDLLIDRSDGIIDVCEMKYSKEPYNISSDYADELARKRSTFQSVTNTKSAVHSIMITTEGLAHNEHWGEVQAEIQLNDLYEL